MKKVSAILFVLGALPLGAHAVEQNLSYNFLQVSYSDTDVDSGGETFSGDGFGFAGSIEFGPTAFLFAEYESVGADESFDTGFGSVSASVDATMLSAGIGGAWALSDRSNFFARAAFLKADADLDIEGFGSWSDDDTGYGLQLGVRGMASDAMELFASATYVDVFDGSETGFDLGGRFWITPAFGLSLAYGTADDTDSLTLGARFNL